MVFVHDFFSTFGAFFVFICVGIECVVLNEKYGHPVLNCDCGIVLSFLGAYTILSAPIKPQVYKLTKTNTKQIHIVVYVSLRTENTLLL